MADVNEPNREAVRSALPLRPPASGSQPQTTVGISKPTASASPASRPAILPGLSQPPKDPLPIMEPALPLANSPALFVPPVLPPKFKPPPPPMLAKAAVPPSAVTAAAETPAVAVSLSPGPKKETARVALVPDRKSGPVAPMSNTQSLVTPPAGRAGNLPMSIAPLPSGNALDFIPMAFCWGVLGFSALLFLLQLWTYLS